MARRERLLLWLNLARKRGPCTWGTLSACFSFLEPSLKTAARCSPTMKLYVTVCRLVTEEECFFGKWYTSTYYSWVSEDEDNWKLAIAWIAGARVIRRRELERSDTTSELCYYRRIPKVTTAVTFEFRGQKGPLLSDVKNYFRGAVIFGKTVTVGIPLEHELHRPLLWSEHIF